MLDTLITSKTRLKLLVKFFLNASTRSYLRDLETEFRESTNGIRIELNRFEDAGMLLSEFEGNRKMYRANTSHPLFGDIHNILLKYTGLDQVIDRILMRLGGLEEAWLIGDFSRGKNGSAIELILVAQTLDVHYLDRLVEKTGQLINRQINYFLVSPEEAVQRAALHPEKLILFGKTQVRGRKPIKASQKESPKKT